MKINKILIAVSCLYFSIANASNNCFIAKENGKIVKQIGLCDIRHSPYSTFKIPIALMGFDAGILKNSLEPAVEVTAEIRSKLPSGETLAKYPVMQLWALSPQTPTNWMTYSIVWYSQWVTEKLGAAKFEKYLKAFNYGNMEGSGTPGKNDGLLNSWINNSLQISGLEQVNFIEKLTNKTLPVSINAHENTIKLLKLEKTWEGWDFYGKSGGGMELGWFVGWIEKEGRRIVFAQYIELAPNSLISGGRIAREVARDNLVSLMLSLDK